MVGIRKKFRKNVFLLRKFRTTIADYGKGDIISTHLYCVHDDVKNECKMFNGLRAFKRVLIKLPCRVN